jgi:hypothetical protein
MPVNDALQLQLPRSATTSRVDLRHPSLAPVGGDAVRKTAKR